MRGWDMSSTCAQGGLPRSLGGYQPNVMMEALAPATVWPMHHPTVTKQESTEEGRNDSGINSVSDFHSSPGSDPGNDFNMACSPPVVSSHPPYYAIPTSLYTSTPVSSTYNMSPLTPQYNPYQPISPYSIGFNNPLTPPSSEPMASPKNTTNIKEEEHEEPNTTLTPQISPAPQEKTGPEEDDALRRLQMSLQKSGFLPPASPKARSEHSNDEDSKSETNVDDDEHLRVPKLNSHGKVKTYKCKQCQFSAITKLEFWEHSPVHIKPEKRLPCPKCPFVTEYKHHLEYHLRNHYGSKPFKCDKCNYSCVNKPMLNSHMKSHSNVYQYRCAECDYATKYCHSLKLHLRKYKHKPAMVLNPDGSPNPLPIIDVYGTRRGPKLKTQQSREDDLQQQQNNIAQMMLATSGQLPLPFPYPMMNGFPSALANQLFFPQLAKLINDRKMASEEVEDEEEEEEEEEEQVRDMQEEPVKQIEIDEEEVGALDLTKHEAPVKNRRKGRAFKIERNTLNKDQVNGDDDDEEEEIKEIPKNNVGDINVNNNNVNINNNVNNKAFTCQFCCMSFEDVILYTMHMGYHDYKEPFTCNMCGEHCTDRVSFFVHIARSSHD